MLEGYYYINAAEAALHRDVAAACDRRSWANAAVRPTAILLTPSFAVSL